MILIDDIFVSDDVINEHFVCNLKQCKGLCCIEGDGGAPLEHHEAHLLEKIYPHVAPMLTPEGIEAIAKQGYHTQGEDQRRVTPLINGGACAYLTYENGIALCGIEKAYIEGKISFKKPISCHLYPIRIDKVGNSDALNYYYWDICKSACSYGKSQKVRVYQFLKEPIVRKYGESFYEKLDATANHLLSQD